ncbi:MAG: DUF4430 domain-containing protein [Candidatus Helarchaeota archaeon]
MEKEKIIIVILTGIIITAIVPPAVIYFMYQNTLLSLSNPPNGDGTYSAFNVTVTINYNNGSSPAVFYDIKGNNALDVLEAVATVTPHPVYGRAYIWAINGYYGNGWRYSVDGFFPSVAAIMYPIQNNSIVLWIAVA